MKNTLTKILGTGLIGVASLLPGCAILDSASNKAPTNTPSIQAKDEIKNERKPITVSGSAYERITSNTILASGTIDGNGPCGETYLEARVGTDKFWVAGSVWDTFSISDGKNTEIDYTFETRLKLTDNITIGGDAAVWSFGNRIEPIMKFPIFYKNENFAGFFKSLIDRNNGVLYVAGVSYTVPVEGTELKFTPKISTGWGDNFLTKANTGYLHVTPGVGAHLGHLGSIDVNGDIQYQFGFNGKPSLVYGGLNFEIKTDKKPLRGEKK